MEGQLSRKGILLVSRIRITAFLFLSSLIMEPVSGQDRYAAVRERMVKQQLSDRGIIDKATLAAMLKVRRHLFVPAGQMSEAYDDGPLPIGYGQTISQPYMVAYMTEAIRPSKGMKVLEIGTGSGYQAAVLAEIVDSVFTIEIVEPLGKQSATLLKSLGFGNVQVRIGDGFAGWPQYSPYDAIIITAAAEDIPPPLAAQLKEGGRLIIPIGKPGQVQTLVLATKIKGKLVKTNLFPVRFVPFTRDK